jgi:hypothetical protein
VRIEGWIPTRLELDGVVDASALPELRRLLPDLRVVDEPSRLGDNGRRSVQAVVEAPDRQLEYRLAVRAGMTDLIRAIRGSRRLEVTEADGLRSLELAIRATP